MLRLRLLLPLLLVFAVAACDSVEETSLYDPNRNDNPAPVIDNVSPQGVVLAGVDVMTISGRNFAPQADHNIVFFDNGQGQSARAQILEASATQLRVRAPNLLVPNLRIRVAVRGATHFSNAVPVTLSPAFERVLPTDDVNAVEVYNGATSDAQGNLYFSLFNEQLSPQVRGIKRQTPDGVRTDFNASTFIWQDLAMGPDGALYGVRGVRAAFRLPQNANQQTVAPQMPVGVVAQAIDVDAQGTLWVGSAGGDVFRLVPNGTVTAFPAGGAVQAVLARPDAVYAAVTFGVGNARVGRVVRMARAADGTLGAPQTVFDVNAAAGTTGLGVFALAMAQDGTLFVATDAPNPIYEVSPAGTASVLYPGVLPSPIYHLAWGAGTKLYAVKKDNPLTLGVTEQPALFRIETRRQGQP